MYLAVALPVRYRIFVHLEVVEYPWTQNKIRL